MRDVAPGSAVTSPQYRFAEGAQKIVVTCADATDRGEAVSIDVFAGFDIPAAPQGVVLTEADGKPQLSWQPVAMGANGGSVGRVTYTVTRMPAQQTVAQDIAATTFTDTAYTPDGRAIYYTVTARNSAGTSAPAASNKLAIGAEFTLPFTESFDTEDDFDLWTVLNANGGSTWSYEASSKSAVYTYDDNHLEGDDWLFSPAFSLQKGKKYKLSYSFRIRQKNYAESFSVHLGKAQTAAGQQQHAGAGRQLPQIGQQLLLHLSLAEPALQRHPAGGVLLPGGPEPGRLLVGEGPAAQQAVEQLQVRRLMAAGRQRGTNINEL